VAGYDTTLDYDKLCRLCDAVRRGLPFVGRRAIVGREGPGAARVSARWSQSGCACQNRLPCSPPRSKRIGVEKQIDVEQVDQAVVHPAHADHLR